MMDARQTAPKTKKRAGRTTEHDLWRQHFVLGRRYISEEKWPEAMVQYRQAFSFAEAVLEKSSDDKDAGYAYLRTTLELIFTMRMNEADCDYPALIAIAKFYLQQHELSSGATHPLSSLEDIAYSPMSEVVRWMAVLLAIDMKKKSIVH